MEKGFKLTIALVLIVCTIMVGMFASLGCTEKTSAQYDAEFVWRQTTQTIRNR